jgi:hypothetical protein
MELILFFVAEVARLPAGWNTGQRSAFSHPFFRPLIAES